MHFMACATAFAVMYLLSLVGVMLGYFCLRRSGADARASAQDLDPYEAAWLAGGAHRVVGTAVAALIDRKWLALESTRNKKGEITGATLKRNEPPAALMTLGPVEWECYRAAAAVEWESHRAAALGETTTYDSIFRRLTGVTATIERRLTNAGLVEHSHVLPMARALALGGSTVLLAIGLERLVHAMPANHAFWFLVGLLLLNLLQIRHYAQNVSRSTLMGVAALGRVRRAHEVHRARLAAEKRLSTAAATAALLPLSFALLGSQSVMADTQFAGINYAVGGGSANNTGNSNRTGGCVGGSGDGCGGGAAAVVVVVELSR
jgi:uncharacterized protein (TIGR04222 family)